MAPPDSTHNLRKSLVANQPKVRAMSNVRSIPPILSDNEIKHQQLLRKQELEEEYVISPDRLPKIRMDEPREGKRMDASESKIKSIDKFGFAEFRNDAAVELNRSQNLDDANAVARKRPKNALAKRIRQRYIKNMLDDRKDQ